MKKLLALLGLLLAFLPVEGLMADATTDIQLPKMTATEALSIAQKLLQPEKAEKGTVTVVAIDWCKVPPSHSFATRIPGNGTVWLRMQPVGKESSDEWAWFVTYIAHDDKKASRSDQLGVICISDEGQVELMAGVRF
jgi:hypothetical protein